MDGIVKYKKTIKNVCNFKVFLGLSAIYGILCVWVMRTLISHEVWREILILQVIGKLFQGKFKVRIAI